jgi:serine phosphatase RsbU (regulator of sigma subunit)
MYTQTLARTPPFNVLNLDEIDELIATVPTVGIQAGEIIFIEGHSDDKFYILLDGQVEIIKSMGSEGEKILAVRDAGILLGEMSLFSQGSCHTASVRAVTPVVLMKISRMELDSLLNRHPNLAFELVRMFSHRLESFENLTIQDLLEKNRQLRQAYEELKAAQAQIIEKEKLEKELEISAQIQRSILPEKLPRLPGYEIGALMVPARQVGGDFYTFFQLSKNRLGIVVGDVCDKGVPAALFMALSYSLIRAEAIREDSPVQTLRNVNYHLLQMNSLCLFVTLVYGILDCATGDFHFVRTAHPSPFLLDGDGQVIDVPVASGQPLGIFDNLPIDEQHIQLAPGGTLMLYSDGVSEPEDLQGRDFGMELLSRSVISHRMSSAQQICEHLWQDVKLFGVGLPQQDDFTAVVIKRSLDHTL